MGNLVLSRRIGESITITVPGGKVITLTVTAIDRNKVWIGFEADRSVPILRGELLKPRKEDAA